jgi:flagellar hook protein FlgE
MSFQTGLSGLNASARNLDVIGHNIANANTTGMKAGRAEFSEVYATALGATGGNNGGIGVQVATVSQLFTQGNLKVTGNQLDLAINGGGFFVVNGGGSQEEFYTRNGEFKLDSNGAIITNNGSSLMGYPTNENGQRTGQVLVPLNLPTGEPIAPRPTGSNPIPSEAGVFVTANLAADAPAFGPVTAAASGNLTTSLSEDQKQFGTALNVYDVEGSAISLQLFFVRNASVNNAWQVVASADNGNTGQVLGAITFTNGVVNPQSLASLTPISVRRGPVDPAVAGVYTGNANLPEGVLSFSMNQGSKFSQFGGETSVYDVRQDGYAQGQLTSVDIAENGVIFSRYSNGVSRAEFQIALAKFGNVQGLQPINGGFWKATSSSGTPTIQPAQSQGFGLIRQNALEESNVELTQELVNMIVAQRSYQANAQTIKTQDQVLQTLVNLR